MSYDSLDEDDLVVYKDTISFVLQAVCNAILCNNAYYIPSTFEMEYYYYAVINEEIYETV